MNTIRLNILQQRAMNIIRYLEEIQDVEIVTEDKTDIEPKDIHVPLQVQAAEPNRTPIDWSGIFVGRDTSAVKNYFDNIRGEWEDRY